MEELIFRDGWLTDQITKATREIHIWNEMIEVLQLVKLYIDDEDVLREVEEALVTAEKHYKADMHKFGRIRKEINRKC